VVTGLTVNKRATKRTKRRKGDVIEIETFKKATAPPGHKEQQDCPTTGCAGSAGKGARLPVTQVLGIGNIKVTRNGFLVLSIASLVHAVLVPIAIFLGIGYEIDVNFQQVAVFAVLWVVWIPLVSWASHWEFKRLSVPIFIGFLLILPCVPHLLMYILFSIAYHTP
jgi:hypothetical protein